MSDWFVTLPHVDIICNFRKKLPHTAKVQSEPWKSWGIPLHCHATSATLELRARSPNEVSPYSQNLSASPNTLYTHPPALIGFIWATYNATFMAPIHKRTILKETLNLSNSTRCVSPLAITLDFVHTFSHRSLSTSPNISSAITRHTIWSLLLFYFWNNIRNYSSTPNKDGLTKEDTYRMWLDQRRA